MKLPGSKQAKGVLFGVLVVFFWLMLLCRMNVAEQEDIAYGAELQYLHAYHDWRVLHPETEVIGLMIYVPSGYANEVNKLRQFLPPCGPTPLEKWTNL